jgi:hypothetical protein
MSLSWAFGPRGPTSTFPQVGQTTEILIGSPFPAIPFHQESSPNRAYHRARFSWAVIATIAALPQIVEAVSSLPVQSCVIDGEAIVTDDKGLAVFDLIRGHHHHAGAELCAFDMIA